MKGEEGEMLAQAFSLCFLAAIKGSSSVPACSSVTMFCVCLTTGPEKMESPNHGLTSEVMSQNKSFFPLNCFSQIFVTAMKS
jgi:hypothetical protein